MAERNGRSDFVENLFLTTSEVKLASTKPLQSNKISTLVVKYEHYNLTLLMRRHIEFQCH